MLCSGKSRKKCEDDFIKHQTKLYGKVIALSESMLAMMDVFDLTDLKTNDFKKNTDLKEFTKDVKLIQNKEKALASCVTKMCAKSKHMKKMHEEDIRVKKQLAKLSHFTTPKQFAEYVRKSVEHEKKMKKLRTDTKHLRCQMQKCEKEVHNVVELRERIAEKAMRHSTARK